MKHLRTEIFDIAYFQDYVESYHERYPDQQNIMFLDMLYGMGLAIDPVKYKNADGFKKFIEWIAESHIMDENDQAMDFFMAEENKRNQEETKHNDILLDELRKSLGEKYVKDIIECLEQSEAHGKLEIVDKPDIEPQYEEWDSFDHILVNQYVNGGMSGDEYTGFVYIPLKEGKYLKSYYSM